MIYVGISGWIYPGWRGRFYPAGLAQRLELHYASRRFNSIEVNGTFYSLKPPDAFRRWHAETPPGFVFALKGGRYITHMLKAAAVETALANYFASGLLALGDRLGPVLWQFPERFRFDAGRMERFLALLPPDTEAASRLAGRHDARILRRGAWFGPVPRRPLRHAVEVRHASFADARFLELLRQFGVALVVSDAPAWPQFVEVTADFVYVRLHGAEELYASGYDDDALDRWAERVRGWAAAGRRDVHVYFDNDAKVRAPFDALGMMARLGVAVPEQPEAAGLPGPVAPPSGARARRGGRQGTSRGP
jgi:uncharacterized protein YecE (DUF72 family)